MTSVIIDPNSTVSNTGAPIGGADIDAILSDSSDGTYIEYDLGESSVVGLESVGLAAGDRLISAKIWARARKDSGNPSVGAGILKCTWGIGGADDLSGQVNVNSKHFSDILVASLTTVPPVTATPDNSALTLETVAGGPIRVAKTYVEVIYAEQPSLTFVGPSAVLDDDTPDVEWTPDLDSDGGPQAAFRVAIMAFGQHPDTHTPVVDSGIVFGNATTWQPDDPVPNATYAIYVKVAQSIGGELNWSPWVGDTSVSVNVPAPPTPSLSVTADDANGRVEIELTDGAGGTTITDRYEVQRRPVGGSDDDWVTVNSDGLELPRIVDTGILQQPAATGTHVVPLPNGIQEDDILIGVAAADGNVSFTWPAGWTEIKDEPGNANAVRPSVAWKRADGTESGTISVATSGPEECGILVHCIRHAHPTQAPEVSTGVNGLGDTSDPDSLAVSWGADYTLWIAANARDDSPLNPPLDYFDEKHAASPASISVVSIQTAYHRTTASSDNPGAFFGVVDANWRAFTIGVRIVAPVAYDYSGPNGINVEYRARGVHDFDVAAGKASRSAWSAPVAVMSWTSSDWFLKHPFDSSKNVRVTARSQPGMTIPARLAIKQALDRSDVAAIADKRGPKQGEIVFKVSDQTTRDALEALLREAVPILIQAPADTEDWEDRWCVIGDYARTRAVDSGRKPWTFDSLPWTEVAEPEGAFGV